MVIKGISNSTFIAGTIKNVKNNSALATDQKDKIVISAEGRDLAKTEFSTSRISELRDKVNSGFYDSDEVLNKVADKILIDLQK